MTFQKSVLSLALAAALSSSAIASTPISELNYSSTKTVTTEIKSMIEDLDIDYSKVAQSTIKVKFMVNENDELIVISTGDSGLDNTIKSALNYKEVNTEGLKPYSVYIVPVTFKTK